MFCQCNYAERLKRSQLGLKDAALRHTILARHPRLGPYLSTVLPNVEPQLCQRHLLSIRSGNGD